LVCYSQFSLSIFYCVYSYHIERTQFKLFIIVKLKAFLCLIPHHKNVYWNMKQKIQHFRSCHLEMNV